MLMVVFGAGASYDSIPSRVPSGAIKLEERLPLADELFDDRPEFVSAMVDFPRCQPVIPYLRQLPPGSTVERVLEGFQAEAREYPMRYRQLAAIRYYLHTMLWACDLRWQAVARGVTNYKTLLDQIQRWRKPEQQVCLVTFNYDRMLEAALPSVGLNIERLRDYITSDDYKVIKLHGSVNWAREVNTPIDDLQNLTVWQVASELIERAPDLDITQRYRIVSEYPIGKSESGAQALFPALAIPVETKRDYECPEEHLVALRECVGKVSKLLLIGWRATEEHFLGLLRDNLPSGHLVVMAVAGREDEATKTLERIKRAGVKGEFIPTTGGFSDFIVRREGDDFLKL
jgi:hypothetical protein